MSSTIIHAKGKKVLVNVQEFPNDFVSLSFDTGEDSLSIFFANVEDIKTLLDTIKTTIAWGD